MATQRGRGVRKAKSSGADISEFADITHESWEGGGLYRAVNKENGDEVGHMRYLILLDDDRVIRVQGTYVDPQYRGRKVATALGEKLHLDHPDHFLDLAGGRDDLPTPAFWDYLREAEPDWDTTVINDGARERVRQRRDKQHG